MRKLTKEQVLQYLNLIGFDETDLACDFTKGVNLDNISSIYIKSKAKEYLPKSSKNLAQIYDVLLTVINDDFWYQTEEEKIQAYNSALEIIGDLTTFNVTEGDDPEVNFERTNNLLTTIISGLCSCDDLNRFRVYQRNINFKEIYNSKKEYDDMPESLVLLYLLIAYSKFKDIGNGYLMFDEENKVTFDRLGKLILDNVANEVPLKEENLDFDYGYDNVKRLKFQRPSLKQLRK